MQISFPLEVIAIFWDFCPKEFSGFFSGGKYILVTKSVNVDTTNCNNLIYFLKNQRNFEE